MQLAELEFLVVPAAYTYLWSFGDGTTSTTQNPQHTYATNGNYTAILIVSDGLSSVTNALNISAAAPLLTISRGAFGQVVLSWPTSATGYAVQSTTNLTPPVIWLPVTNAVGIAGNQFVVTLPIESTGKRLFILSTAVSGKTVR
jgi:PKD repeat protein